MKTKIKRFVICVSNGGRPASLEVRKVYQVIPDPEAELYHCLRVIDESGEDYLHPADCFVSIELPQSAKRALVAA